MSRNLFLLLVMLLPSSLWAGSNQHDGRFSLTGKLGENINFAIFASYRGDDLCMVVGETNYTRQNGKVSTIKLYGTISDNHCYLYEMVDNQVCGNFEIEMPSLNELDNPQQVDGREIKGCWRYNDKEYPFNGVHLGQLNIKMTAKSDRYSKFMTPHANDWRRISGQYGYWNKSCPGAESEYLISLDVTADSVYWHTTGDNEMCGWDCNFTTPGYQHAQKNDAYCFSPKVDGGEYKSIVLNDVIFLDRTNDIPEETDNFVQLSGIYPKFSDHVSIHATRSFDDKNPEAISYVDLDLQVPYSDNKRLNDSIHAWVCNALNHGNAPYLDYWEIAQGTAESLLEGFFEPEKDDDGKMELWQLNNAGRNVRFSDYDKKKYLNLTSSGYDYMGGAHPFSYSYTQTLRRSDGKVMRYLDWFTNLDKVRAIVEKYMRQLEDIEFDAPRGSMELPYNEPYFSNGNFIFEFQQYEAAPYCYGMPSCEVPLSVLMPYLTQAAKNLVK